MQLVLPDYKIGNFRAFVYFFSGENFVYLKFKRGKVHILPVLQENDDAIYRPTHVGGTLQIGPITVENLGYNLHEYNPNISIRNLRLTVEGHQHVGLILMADNENKILQQTFPFKESLAKIKATFVVKKITENYIWYH